MSFIKRVQNKRYFDKSRSKWTTVKVEVLDLTGNVKKAYNRGNLERTRGAAAYIYTVIKNSIKTTGKPNPPGGKVKSRYRVLKSAMAFNVDDDRGTFTVGTSARDSAPNLAGTHEFGGEFRGRNYPARPFMRPGLEASLPKLPEKWKNILVGR